MDTMEIKLPKDFSDEAAFKEYFAVSDDLARHMISRAGWLRVDEERGLLMFNDPRFLGIKARSSEVVYECSWYARGSKFETAA